jgi:hypothetical protein
MASLIGLVVSSGVILASNYYNRRLSYLKSAKSFDPNVFGPSYLYLRPSMFNLIKFDNLELLTKETITRRRLIETSISLTGSNFDLAERYQFVSSKILCAKLNNSLLRTDELLKILHDKYQVKIFTTPLYSSDMFRSGRSEVRISTNSFSSSISDNTYRDEVYGVINDDSEYLIVGDYRNDTFVNNQQLTIEKEKTIDELIQETDDSVHSYYKFGGRLLVFSLIVGLCEAYYFFG